MQIKICHMTSAHKSGDTRIFHKECVSLAKAGYEVFLVANGESYYKDGVSVIGIGEPPASRLKRMTQTVKKIYNKAIEVDADIYHFHDPELLPYGLKLKRKGKKVIFDSHEDYLLTVSEKSWIPKLLRPLVLNLYKLYEEYICSRLDGIAVCYHWTEERLKKHCENTKMVLNFPIVDQRKELPTINFDKRAVSFAGNISKEWNHKEILQAIELLPDVNYELAGELVGQYGIELKEMRQWDKVNYHGRLSVNEVFEDVYANSSIGMALLDYIPQCMGTIGNLSNTKFFEYMYMGMPLICTNFKLWKDIIDEEQCGIYVNPHNVEDIKKAIDYLLNNPNIAKQMGENGQNAVLVKYNWGVEEKKLLELYSDIASNFKEEINNEYI
jgi:glycosyltransferase involved in cell wall biosynthesis